MSRSSGSPKKMCDNREVAEQQDEKLCNYKAWKAMLRRSLRLQEAGYYKEDGTPSVSYKEILYRVFRRRYAPRGHQSMDHQDLIDGCHSDETYDEDIPGKTSILAAFKTMCSLSFKVFGFLLLLLLVFGFKDMHFQLRDLQQEVHAVKHRMNRFAPAADSIPNFALESQGAKIQWSLSSDTFCPAQHMMLWDRMLCICESEKTQRVIQGHSSLLPGQCWCFPGNRGHLFISLSHPVSISHVTLGHITKSQSPNGKIVSAPKEFSIYGMRTTDEDGTFLGTLVYDQDGEPFQTFELPNQDKGVFSYVKLDINSNCGNDDYTCIYSFRVHGKLQE